MENFINNYGDKILNFEYSLLLQLIIFYIIFKLIVITVNLLFDFISEHLSSK